MYKAFRVVYTLLTLNFILPAIYYCFDPQGAATAYYELASFVGSEAGQPWAENSRFWLILAIGNVATLGFICFLMLRDLRANFNMLVPLCFLKSCSILGFFVAWVTHGHPAFLIGVLFDLLTLFCMVFFARGAHRELCEATAE
jgi:hypothetical protein